MDLVSLLQENFLFGIVEDNFKLFRMWYVQMAKEYNTLLSR